MYVRPTCNNQECPYRKHYKNCRNHNSPKTCGILAGWAAQLGRSKQDLWAEFCAQKEQQQ